MKGGERKTTAKQLCRRGGLVVYIGKSLNVKCFLFLLSFSYSSVSFIATWLSFCSPALSTSYTMATKIKRDFLSHGIRLLIFMNEKFRMLAWCVLRVGFFFLSFSMVVKLRSPEHDINHRKLVVLSTTTTLGEFTWRRRRFLLFCYY